jgi:hypothetical protein
MTALKEFQRLEATALWRASADEQRREVIVSIGEATLTMTDLNDRPLAHWSLAAVRRLNPGERPALFCPDGDPGETLELGDGEGVMIDAIEKVRRAVDRSRPHPGRLRWLGGAAVMLVAAALVVFWLPGALVRYTVAVVPDVKRTEIGEALRSRIERVTGQACANPAAQPPLDRLARRTGARDIAVVRDGVAASLSLPGGLVVLNRAVIEGHEDPAVPAGYVLVERVRAEVDDPLTELLVAIGPGGPMRLLTTGQLTERQLDRYAERMLAAPRPPVDLDAVTAAFAAAGVPIAPYARATGATDTVANDAATGAEGPIPVMPDRDWVRLQTICGDAGP